MSNTFIFGKSAMASSSITTKGQVTIPSALREKFQLEPGDKVLFLEKDGVITLVPMKQDITHLAGCLADDVGGRRASLEDMESAIREGATKDWGQNKELDNGRD
ncbi:AbrB/MazE/SpoVT family DNA-binding domain-containing protein [Endozoicomonas sp. ALD040]|uniref:AbrB/MazE/SpoVT family DNA-binding domain-containing protein n=1 Tax=Endozoicomonas sp. ALD040 TaxID=3403079 RepID=UPI003BAEF2B3